MHEVPQPTSAVLLDALGTLLTFEPPAPHLRAALSRLGIEVSEETAAAAIRAEIAYYRSHLHEGRDAASLDGPAHAGADADATLHDRIPSAGPGAEALVADREAKAKIDRAIAALPPDQREVFLMREVMDMPFAEIAVAVGASEPTVKSRMRYALEKLRAALVDLSRDAGAAESSGSG